MPSDKANSYFQSQQPMDALAGLHVLFGNEQKHPDVLLRFLQLGNEIQGEPGGVGRDDQVLQLIQALLAPQVGLSANGIRGK